MLSAEEATRDSRVEGSSGSAVDVLQDVVTTDQDVARMHRSSTKLTTAYHFTFTAAPPADLSELT